jgi:hypothetical protein
MTRGQLWKRKEDALIEGLREESKTKAKES